MVHHSRLLPLTLLFLGSFSLQAQDKSGSRPGLMKLPESGGTVTSETGSFSIASNKGSSQYNLPLPELPSRAGFGPKIALSYNQFTGDQGQGLGISWSLGIPSIEASTELGIPLSGVLPSGEFRNFFTFQGQKLVFLRNSAGKIYYRLKASEEYIQFIYHNNPYTLTKARPVNGVQPSISRGFEVIYPNGRRQLYSGDPSLAEGSPKNITRYVLTHEVDTTGETISYSYVKDAGRSYLQEIAFAGGASRYRFEMIDGLGHLHSYAMGHQQENRKLYSKLIASYNDSVQAQWCMAYVGRNPNDRNQFVVKSHADCQDQATRDLSGQIDGNSLSVLDELRSIYRYGSASTLTADTERLPTMRFAYSSWSQDRLASRDLVYPLTSLAESAQFSVQNYELADVNHDGLVDAIRKNSNGTSDIFSSTGDLQNLFKKPDFWKLTSRDRSVSPDLSSTNFHFADFNGDSFVDLLQYDSADTFIYFGGAAGGFTWTGRSAKLTADDSLHAASFFRGQAQFTDINNDGKSDVITTAFDTNGQTVWKVYLNLSIQEGNRWQFKFSPKTFAFPFPDSQINLSDNNFRLTDVNGDKLPDVIYLSSSVEADQSGLCVYLNQGQLYDLGARDLLFGNNQETSPRCGRGGRFISLHGLQGKTNLNGLWLADVNGDGILDVTTIGKSNQDLLVWLGFGDLAVSRDPLTLRLKVPVQVSSSFDASRSRVADIDGDGQVEILVFDESASAGNKALMIDFNREKDRQLIKSNLLVTVDFESGLRYDIRYATSTTERLRDLRLGQPTSALHFPVVVAKQLISSMGVPSLARRSVQVQEFFYHRPYYDPDNKEFLGFSEVETLVYGDNYSEESSYTQESFHTYSSDIASRLMAGKTRSKKVSRVMEDDWFSSMSQSTNKFDPTNPSTHSWLNESEGQQLPRLGQVVAEETQTWETVPAEGDAYYLRKTAQTMRRSDEDKGSASTSPLQKTVVFSDFDRFNMPRLMEETVDAIEAPFDLRLPAVQTVTRLDYESSRSQLAELAIIDRPDYEMVQRGETVASFTQYQYNDQGQVLVETDFVESHMPADAPEIVQNGLGSYERKINYTYDGFGNKISETDALGLLESIEYDEQGVFAVRRTLPKANPSSEDSVWTMEYDAGRLKSFTSPIGLKTTFSYDQLGRRVRMLTSDGSEQLYSYRQGLDGHPSMMLTKIRRYPDAAPASERESTWVAHLSAYRADGLKLAEVEDASEGHKGSRRGIRIKEYAAYDRNKRQIFTWTPYSLFEGSPSVEQVFASSPDIPQPKETVGTWFRYDYLGRLKQRQQPTGLVETYSYAPWGETNLQSFNRLDKHVEVKTYSISHELGIFANVQEDLSSKERHVTRFERDELGKLTSIDLPGVNQTRRLAHDSRGLIEFQEIPGLGRWYYLYDQRDHLVKTIRVSADESVTHVVENAYDLQDRLISQTLDGQLTHVNTYDVYPDDWKPRAGLLKQPIGLLTATKSFDHNLRTLNYSKFLSYDSSGMLTEVEAKLGDKSWKESYGYLLDGSAKSMTNPSGLEGIYTNDEAGRLRSVAIRLPGASKLESVIDSVSYDSKGRMNEIYYRPVGDSLSSTRLGYNPRTLLLEEIQSIYRVAGKEYALQDLKQVTDENAYILAIEDRIKNNEFGLVNRSASFDYNWKGELTQSKRYTKTYEYRYSPAGTFTRNDEQGPGTIRTAAASDLLPQGPAGLDYGFDSFGQLTRSPNIQNARYNALGQMTMVETSQNLTNFGYNATGERIWKQVHDKASALTLTSYYPLKSVMLEPKSGQSFIFVGDQRLVRLEDASGDWYYYLKDHLGSSDIVMHSSGRPVEQMLYQPYGSEEDPAKMSAAWASYSKTPSLPVPLVKTHHRFTGHYLDDESGLYYMNARYYDAKLGRFATPDPLYLGEPERCAKRPVECNLYSYAQNNPIKYIDPSGLITYNADNKTWSVDKGDTVDSIAKDTGFTAKEIKDANGGDKFVPKAGSSITIPQNTRIKTFEEAAGQIGSKDYAYATRKENFGANKWKCNQFVHNMIRDSGGKPPKSGKSIWPAQAGDWGGKASLKNTTLLAKGYQDAAPGDVVGWKRDYSDATGHTMIYAGNVKILSGGQVFQSKGGGGFIGAGSAEVEYKSYDTMSRYKPTEGVYRRVQ